MCVFQKTEDPSNVMQLLLQLVFGKKEESLVQSSFFGHFFLFHHQVIFVSLKH